MKAVLHDSVNAWSIVWVGWSPSALWNTSPLTVRLGGQLAGEEGERPRWMSAVEVSTLNVEPGGKAPCSAWS